MAKKKNMNVEMLKKQFEDKIHIEENLAEYRNGNGNNITIVKQQLQPGESQNVNTSEENGGNPLVEGENAPQTNTSQGNTPQDNSTQPTSQPDSDNSGGDSNVLGNLEVIGN